MLFGDEDLKEFQAIYQEDFGETISDADARFMATRLIRLYEVLAQSLPEEKEQLAGFQESATMEAGSVEESDKADPATLPQRSFLNNTNSYQ